MLTLSIRFELYPENDAAVQEYGKPADDPFGVANPDRQRWCCGLLGTVASTRQIVDDLTTCPVIALRVHMWFAGVLPRL